MQQTVAFNQGNAKRPDGEEKVTWNIARRQGKRMALNKDNAGGYHDRQGREGQSWHSGQSGSSVSGHQVPVRICESALLRLVEDQRPTRHTVCGVKFVDGARQTAGSAGMSSPEIRGNALQGLKTGPMGGRNGATLKDCA
jgi:hypothetical protein